MEENLDITKPRFSEPVLPVPWPFIISRFHSTGFRISCQWKLDFEFQS